MSTGPINTAELDRKVAETAAAISERIQSKPKMLLVLGSGLGPVADEVEDATDITSTDLEHLSASTVPGHVGTLRFGQLGGMDVMVQRGRVHLYEGHGARDVTRVVEVAAAMGVSTLVVTNAAGGLHDGFTPGDLMLITDHINMTGTTPLTGRLLDGKPPFIDMTRPYDPGLGEIARAQASELGLELKSGTYVGLTGPSYETPAEVKMLRTIGGDAVGMSTVNEVIAARAEDMRVLGISSITNVHREDQAEVTHDEVLEVGQKIAKDLTKLVMAVVKQPGVVA